jgi:hypothetical protein
MFDSKQIVLWTWSLYEFWSVEGVLPLDIDPGRGKKMADVWH